ALATYNHFNPLPTGIAAQQPTVFTGGMVPQVNDQITRVEGEGLAGNSDPLSQLATHTGGAYLFSQDNVNKFFHQAVADLTTYYEAAYVPSAQVYDGKFHQITVKPVRAKLKLQTRAGYFAVPPAAGVMAFEAPMVKVFSDQNLPADLPFETAVLQLGTMATGNENTLVVEVPISGLETHRDPNANLLSWHLSVVSQIKDKTGAVVEHFSEDIPGHGALDAKEPQACATMQRHFTLLPGEYTIETVVGDRNSGKLGAKRTQLQIPNTASAPFLSDVAMVRRVDPYPQELDPFEPLRYQEGKIVPNVSHQVIDGAKQSSFFFLVHSDSGASDLAMLEMRIARNGDQIGQVPLQLPKSIEGEAFPYVASLKTSSLPAGNYDVTVSLTQRGKIIERQASFRIPGPELAVATPAKEPLAAANKENENVTDSDSSVPDIATIRRQPLVITALPSSSASRPSDDELNTIIEGARSHALTYTAKLPNFACLELTDRSVDSSGNGKWRRKDSFGEMLRYLDNQETRKVVEVNGRAGTKDRAEISGPLTLGEFGVLLGSVFRPSSRAEFHWKETDALGNGTVQVFEYRVDRKNDSMSFTDSNGRVYAGYHGLAYIDSSTFGVRRITMEADDIPDSSSIRAAAITIDYDYVSVGIHDYLMPVRGTIRVNRGRHEIDLNQIVFQDYRRYASQAKIVIQH
ncbi:MAG TPA: hypothetical protein VLK33_06220, partial [Terriglobales bacterium]|nr:hypothetical protein [Terriglobales bacterium]